MEYPIDFEKSMRFVLSWEGTTLVKDPDDPGGTTKYGISQKSHPSLDIENLTLDEAKELYYRKYWLPADCQIYKWPWCLVIFDTAVNMGLQTARVLYVDSRDWQHYLFLRLKWYSKLAKHNHKYLRGWLNRVISLYEEVM